MPLPLSQDTTRTKTGNEVWVFYNLCPGKKVKQVAVLQDGSTINYQYPHCGGGERQWQCLASGGFEATVIRLQPNIAAVGNIPANSPIGTAIEGSLNPVGIADAVDHVLLPDPNGDVFLCHDRGFSVTPAPTLRTIPSKFNNLDHRVLQRQEPNTLSLTSLFTKQDKHLNRIMGIPITLIVKISPDGRGASYSEIQYYSNVVLRSKPMNSPSSGNDSVEIQVEGEYDFNANFVYY